MKQRTQKIVSGEAYFLTFQLVKNYSSIFKNVVLWDQYNSSHEATFHLYFTYSFLPFLL